MCEITHYFVIMSEKQKQKTKRETVEKKRNLEKKTTIYTIFGR